MTTYTTAAPLAEQLLDALSAYQTAHERHGTADVEYRTLDRQLTEVKTLLANEIASSPEYKNETQRKAALLERLENEHEALLNDYEDADADRRQAAAELERAEAALKTLRSLASLRAAELHLEAERVAAQRLNDLPF